MTIETKSTQTERIRSLNDRLRQNFSEGKAVMTCGIAALGAEAVARIVQTIEVYDDFCHANDPTKSTTLGLSKPMARRSFSRSIISIRP